MADIRKLLDRAKRERGGPTWEGVFEEYLNMAVADPGVARLSHAFVYDMVQWAGVSPGPEDVARYNLFSGQIFGLDGVLDRVVSFLRAAAAGSDVRKRILLLVGPTGSGKSTIVNLLKDGLERYSSSDDGAVYVIKGCPMQEEPLHLVPEGQRLELAKDGLRIEGELCPRCRYNLRQEYGGDIGAVKVRRVVFSRAVGTGMGHFVAITQPQDASSLVGRVDASLLGDDRLEGPSKGLSLDGELEAANRGIMEFEQILRSDDQILAVLLGAAQERAVKLGSFGSVYVDEVIIAESSEAEYRSLPDNAETAALLDRLVVVKIPYNLRTQDEVKVYEKLLGDSPRVGAESVHGDRIAPLTLHVAAMVSVLSRLEIGRMGSGLPKVSPLDKMRLYDGQLVPPYTMDYVQRVRAALPREGMFGLSPRYVANRLADALAGDEGCLTPSKALKSLAEGLGERASIDREDGDRIIRHVGEALGEYKDLAIREVQRAATEKCQQRADELFLAYVQGLESLLGDRQEEPDEGLLRRVEGGLGMKDGERPTFRREVWEAYGHLSQPWLPAPGYGSIPTLKLAIENLLFPRRDEVRLTMDPGSRDPERQLIIQRLISEQGYCQECADDLMEFAWRTLRGEDVMSVKKGRLSVAAPSDVGVAG